MKKYMRVMVLFLLVVCVFATHAWADSSSYTANLPKGSLPVSVVNGEKSTSNKNATNRIDFLGGTYDSVKAWIDDEEGYRVANKKTMYVDEGTYTLPYNRTISVGEWLTLRMSNNSFAVVNVTVEGYVNFR